MNQTTKLISLKILMHFFPGVTGSKAFGTIPSVYCIHRGWAAEPAVSENSQSLVLKLPEFHIYQKYPWYDIRLGRKDTKNRAREEKLINRSHLMLDWRKNEDNLSLEDAKEYASYLISNNHGMYGSGHLQLKLAEFAGWLLSTNSEKFAQSEPWENRALLVKIKNAVMPDQVKNAYIRKLLKIRKIASLERTEGKGMTIDMKRAASSARKMVISEAKNDFAVIRKRYRFLASLLYGAAYHLAETVFKALRIADKGNPSSPRGLVELLPLQLDVLLVLRS